MPLVTNEDLNKVGNESAPLAGSAEDKKAKKLESLVRFKERKAARELESYKTACELRDALKQRGILSQLSDRARDYLASLCVDPAVKKPAGTGQPSILLQLYGPSPKVGDSVTLKEAFERTAKGKQTLDILIRRWADKGTVIEVVPAVKVADTKYVIKSLPAA